MSTGGIVLVALAIAIGLMGIIVPILPGGLLVFAAIAVWAVIERTTVAWVVLQPIQRTATATPHQGADRRLIRS